jgi:predicted ATPase
VQPPHIRRRPPPIGQSGESRAPTLGGFTEGFATADLQEAQALLEALF